MTWGSPCASLYVKCVGTVRAASHPPVWIHRKCELRSLKKTLNGLCLDDDYTIAQWLEHRWLQARVPGSSPGGDSQFFLQTFPVCLFPSKPVNIIIIIIIELFAGNLPTLKRALHFTQIHWYRYNVSVFMTIIRNEVDMERTAV